MPFARSVTSHIFISKSRFGTRMRAKPTFCKPSATFGHFIPFAFAGLPCSSETALALSPRRSTTTTGLVLVEKGCQKRLWVGVYPILPPVPPLQGPDRRASVPLIHSFPPLPAASSSCSQRSLMRTTPHRLRHWRCSVPTNDKAHTCFH